MDSEQNCSSQVNLSMSDGGPEGPKGMDVWEVANRFFQGSLLPLLAATGFIGRWMKKVWDLSFGSVCNKLLVNLKL